MKHRSVREGAMPEQTFTASDEIDVLWITAALGCDGDTVALTAATQPSIEDLILLDLNLPKKNGREVLAELKQDPDLKSIPVLVLRASRAPQDIRASYDLCANCYLVKPSDIEEFIATVRSIEGFWLTRAKLPAP